MLVAGAHGAGAISGGCFNPVAALDALHAGPQCNIGATRMKELHKTSSGLRILKQEEKLVSGLN